jgi:hypothetical protein
LYVKKNRKKGKRNTDEMDIEFFNFRKIVLTKFTALLSL